ncbi:PTS sugar transporter subunit IIC [Marinilactibacillus psychrotolerans]|uniref:PTS sugar transporter subunit IIC n=1 Tax=Marinilactibacillus psychrotolerans TaxID=191770 RepID=UPI0038892A17
MDKIERTLNKILVPISMKLNSQRHLGAVRDAFILAFPLTMAGSLILLVNFAILAPDGFIASLLQLERFFPNLAEAQQIFSPVVRGTNDVLAIFIVFMISRNITQSYKKDALLGGLTAISTFFILYPPYETINDVNYMTVRFIGAEGLFVAMIVGLIVGEIFSRLSGSERLKIKMPEQVPPAVARSFSALIPIIIILMLASIVNFGISLYFPEGLNELIFTLIQAPLTNIGGNVLSIIFLAMISNLLWVLGIHGPNTIAAVRDPIFSPMGVENLNHIADTGSTWGVPYPINWGSMNDGFANYGGSGMTLGLLIAIFIISKRKDFRNIAKLSFVPGLFNINEPVIFGLPIVLNPIMIIPFVLTPVINIMIGYFFTITELIPPIGYSVPWTTPGFLIPFLGTGGNWGALAVGLLCLGVSVLTYMPFVIASNKAAIEMEDEGLNEESALGNVEEVQTSRA